MKGKEAAEVEDDRSAHKRGSTSTCRFLVDLARPRAVPAQPVAQTLTKLFHRAWGATSAAHRGQEPPRRRARRQCRAGAAPAAGGPHRTGRRGLSRAWKAWTPRSSKNIDARAVAADGPAGCQLAACNRYFRGARRQRRLLTEIDYRVSCVQERAEIRMNSGRRAMRPDPGIHHRNAGAIADEACGTIFHPPLPFPQPLDVEAAVASRSAASHGIAF